jgi:hypothetical protein
VWFTRRARNKLDSNREGPFAFHVYNCNGTRVLVQDKSGKQFDYNVERMRYDKDKRLGQ